MTSPQLASSTTTESPWSFTQKEFSHYLAYFHKIVPEGESLSGSRAFEFFSSSNLPLPTLALIWEISDYDQDGRLNAVEFSFAINFCQLALDGLHPPSALPSDMQSLAQRVTNPDTYLIPMKQNQMEKCMSVFMSFVENNGVQGYLAGEAAKYLLSNSQLPKAILFHIWKLADQDQDGRLTFKEFVLAMHLVFISKLNHPLPLAIDPAKVLPQEFNALEKKVTDLVSRKPLNKKHDEAWPSVPSFAMPTNHPFLSPVFKGIQTERFLNEKFDDFIGNPFKKETTTTITDDVSHSTSSRLSSDSESVSKLSSASQHSSNRSLVEDKDILSHNAEAVNLQEMTQLVNSKRKEEFEDDDDNGEMDAIEQQQIEQELDAISKTNEKYLQQNEGSATPRTGKSEIQQQSVMAAPTSQDKNESLTPVIRNQSPSTKPGNQSPSTKPGNQSPSTKPGNQSPSTKPVGQSPGRNTPSRKPKGDVDLSFLDDLEAQVMDVLDETNSFDPSKVAPAPPPWTTPPLTKPSAQPKKKTSYDETDSTHTTPLSPSKSKTLPHKRGTFTGSSPFEIRPRISSSDSDPTYRRNTLAGYSPRRKPNNENLDTRASLILDDLDDIFTDELAQIDGIMNESKNKLEKRKKRAEKEMEELKNIETKLPQSDTFPSPTVSSMEEVSRRRDKESMHMQAQWEKEVEGFTKQAHDEQMTKQIQLMDDESIHDLEKQFQDLLLHEAEQMKGARTIRAQRLKEMEIEEAERRERIREQMKGKNEVTVEEWIKMMEENKLKEMTPKEKEEYHERKRLWLKQREEKEEEKRRREEEQIKKNRDMMRAEYYRQQRMEAELEKARLTRDELTTLEKEQHKKEAEERKYRTEQARVKKEEMKQKEIENSKPKAKSDLAAKWEEKVKKGKNGQDSKPAYQPPQPQKSASERELERLAKRVGKI